jgi:hypothetical protein
VCGSKRSRLTECATLTVPLSIEKSGVLGRSNYSINVRDDTIVGGGHGQSIAPLSAFPTVGPRNFSMFDVSSALPHRYRSPAPSILRATNDNSLHTC